MEYVHIITNAETGEVSEIPFTDDEILQRQAEESDAAAKAALEADPVAKLKAFLNANPDVAQVLAAE